MAEKSGELENIGKVETEQTALEAGDGRALKGRTGDHTGAEAHQFGAASDASGPKVETDHMRAQIEETRSNMGETIDAIQDRLSLSNISEQVSVQVNNAFETVKDNVYDATVGKAVTFMKNAGNEINHSSIVMAAKANPLPFVLIGLGAGLLAYNSYATKKNRSFDRQLEGNRVGKSDPAGSDRWLAASAQQTISGVKDSVSSAATTAYEGVANAASSTYTGAGDIANRAYDKAGEFGTKAQEKYSQYLDEKPWAIAAIALGAGAAVGLAIPSTRYEGELMGEARVNLMSKAQGAASDLVDNAKQIASDAGSKINDDIKTLAQETPKKS